METLRRVPTTNDGKDKPTKQKFKIHQFMQFSSRSIVYEDKTVVQYVLCSKEKSPMGWFLSLGKQLQVIQVFIAALNA